jgi:CDP-6-deoxy-D-xylo-4-hexulose-3-dehydrase
MDARDQEIRRQIEQLTQELIQRRQARETYTPGENVPYAGRVYDADEVTAGVNSMLDFWLTLGPEGDAFERELAQYLGVRSCTLVNSGSSANLVALSALTSHKLGERRLKPGDEVITAAAGFPATVTPIVQNHAVPVFVDVDPVTSNLRVDRLADAYVPGKTKAVMIAHTLGNPFDLGEIERFCRERQLWLIEDNCDALGSRYDGQLTGTFGALSTQSFYPPHHVTMGEGGAVNVATAGSFGLAPQLKTIVESFRDWGRDCWCASGKDNTCNKRFCWQMGELPEGYDHKYIYSHLGYNLKPTDPQAAIGRAQLKKLPTFVQARIENWNYLRAGLDDLGEYFDFMLPTHARGWSKATGFSWERGKPVVEPSWFGFMLNVRPTAPFTRVEFSRALDAAKIGNRGLFGGNLLRQPAFVTLRKQWERGEGVFPFAPYRVVGDTQGADYLMNQAIFIGTYPGLTKPQLDYMLETIHQFVQQAGERKTQLQLA